MKAHSSGLSNPSSFESGNNQVFPGGSAALVVAHPGHELRVYGWLLEARPKVFVLTDGSGRTGRSRLSSTTKLGTDAGARFGRIYGRFTDIAVYEALLDGNFEVF